LYHHRHHIASLPGGVQLVQLSRTLHWRIAQPYLFVIHVSPFKKLLLPSFPSLSQSELAEARYDQHFRIFLCLLFAIDLLPLSAFTTVSSFLDLIHLLS
jgi:hypothetical protein